MPRSSILDSSVTETEHRKASARARSFFDRRKLKDDKDFDPTIADTDGFVTFINGSSNEPPESLKQEREKISAILEGLTGIVVAAVLQTAKDEGSNEPKHDPAIWQEPIQYGLSPFISGFSSSITTYDREMEGVEIATAFLDIPLTAAVEEGAALAEFGKFLQSQGEAIEIAAEGIKEGYKFATIGIIHEIFEVEKDEWIYVPKIQAYFTSFNIETFKITSGCGKVQKYSFDFTIETFVAPFKLNLWKQNQWFRDDVNTFIKEYTQGSIEETKNYFDGIFKSKKRVAAP